MSLFPTTHWSVVLRADESDGTSSREALQSLCQTYWFPVYAFARSQGSPSHEAEDLTQGFFEHLIHHELISRVSPELGRFRAFLLVCFKNFCRSQLERARTQKRGGGKTILSIDELQAEDRFADEPVDRLSPERIYERNWALQVLEEARGSLQKEYASQGKQDLFSKLQRFLQGRDESLGYAAVAESVGKSEAAVKMEASRMRRRYGELLRSVVAETLNNPAEVEDELRHLVSVLTY